MTILSKLRYFENVILDDYRAEFFLRNPVFVQVLGLSKSYRDLQFLAVLLVVSTSTRVQVSLVNILNCLCRRSIARIYHYESLENYSSSSGSVKSIENR